MSKTELEALSEGKQWLKIWARVNGKGDFEYTFSKKGKSLSL